MGVSIFPLTTRTNDETGMTFIRTTTLGDELLDILKPYESQVTILINNELYLGNIYEKSLYELVKPALFLAQLYLIFNPEIDGVQVINDNNASMSNWRCADIVFINKKLL